MTEPSTAKGFYGDVPSSCGTLSGMSVDVATETEIARPREEVYR